MWGTSEPQKRYQIPLRRSITKLLSARAFLICLTQLRKRPARRFVRATGRLNRPLADPPVRCGRIPPSGAKYDNEILPGSDPALKGDGPRPGLFQGVSVRVECPATPLTLAMMSTVRVVLTFFVPRNQLMAPDVCPGGMNITLVPRSHARWMLLVLR